MSGLTYESSGAEVIDALLLPAGSDIKPLDWERPKAAMRWQNWDDGFRAVAVPGLAYQGCQMVAGYYRYAVRGNRKHAELSRSQSVRSEWAVEPGSRASSLAGPQYTKITAFFPILDGIGFWIGKRRREIGVQYYTQEQEVALAQASTIGACGMGQDFSQPQTPQEAVFRCVWAPGRAFDEEGNMLQNVSSAAFIGLGLEITEVMRPGSEGKDPRPYRLFGDLRTVDKSGASLSLPFTPAIAEALMPAWRHVNSLPFVTDPPSEDIY